MTRINCLQPEDLTDQHLIAEYRELPRVFGLARELKPGEKIHKYKLGAGHVKFFYDKTLFLAKRHKTLVAECIKRGFNIIHTGGLEPIPGLNNDWSINDNAFQMSRQRLKEKLIVRPDFYRYFGKLVDDKFYNNAYLTGECNE